MSDLPSQAVRPPERASVDHHGAAHARTKDDRDEAVGTSPGAEDRLSLGCGAGILEKGGRNPGARLDALGECGVPPAQVRPLARDAAHLVDDSGSRHTDRQGGRPTALGPVSKLAGHGHHRIHKDGLIDPGGDDAAGGQHLGIRRDQGGFDRAATHVDRDDRRRETGVGDSRFNRQAALRWPGGRCAPRPP